jgi:hypothetical protein
LPNLKVHYLGSADVKRDFQYFRAGYFLTESGVEAGARLLYKPKVKARREGDRWEVVARGDVGIVCGNCRMLPNIQNLDCLLSEEAPKSGLVVLRYRTYQLVSTLSCCSFVSRPVCGTPVTLLGGILRNASKSTGCSPLEAKKRVQESYVAHLIIGIVGDILGPVAVKDLKVSDVG